MCFFFFLIVKNISKNKFWLQSQVIDLAFLSQNFQTALCHIFKILHGLYFETQQRKTLVFTERERLCWRLALASFQNGGCENGAGKWSPTTSSFPAAI